MNYQAFSAQHSPLQTGINLLEASAGTGKTYTIAMLVLRLVVEQGLTIQQILVVTFTKAATEELRQRIRERLLQAHQALHDSSDSELGEWLTQQIQEPSVVRQRLDAALLDIDQAAIFTIHGFCQRVLNEHALQSGQLFDCELASDISALKQQCADDFWRRQLYPRPLWQVALITAHYATPEALLASINGTGQCSQIAPELQALDTLFERIRRLIEQTRADLATLEKNLSDALDQDKFTASYRQRIYEQAAQLADWLDNPNQPAVRLDDWTTEGILAGLNGNKFRTSKANPLSSQEQKLAYLEQLQLPSQTFDALQQALQQLPVLLRRQFYDDLQQMLDQALRQNNVLSFDDLIRRLAQAIQGEQGPDLISALRSRLQAALIDEFQDTDQQQWHIFNQLFACDSHYLYLIGDPKQAIYQFRGADIFSYFAAQSAAQQHYTLPCNWRSHPDLVSAVNGLFTRPEPFLFAQLNFQPVAAARSASEGWIDAGAPLQLWQLGPYSDQQSHWTAYQGNNNAAGERLRLAVVDEIVHLLQAGQIGKQQTLRDVVPSDIAILVRSHRNAREYQQALDALGIKAVLNSKQSVFASNEAIELCSVLLGIVHGEQIDSLKSTLTVRWFGLDGQALYRLLQDDLAMNSWLLRFQDYHRHWQQYGVFSMMQQLLRREQIEQRLASQPQAERALTNIYHLLERLQQTAQEQQLNPQKTVLWLQRAIQQAKTTSSDDAQLRLESDADAVQIVTLHSAKGLEYPIVFCPDLWRYSDRLKTQPWVQCHENGQLLLDLGSEQLSERRDQAWQEQLAEDIRLFYVAVTRAQYRCYLLWADVRSKTQPNASAMAYLLQLTDADFEGQKNRLQQFAEQTSQHYGYRLIDQAFEASPILTTATRPPLPLSARRRQRSLYSHWQMSSYTALSSLSISPELPPDKAFEQPDLVEQTAAESDDLPRGAHTGNVIHTLLETIRFQHLASGGDISQARQQACQRFGLSVSEPASIDQLLQRVVTTALNVGGFSLSQIDDQHCIKEMPFYLALSELDVSHINDILADSPSYQALSAKQISGYLTGFIDLIVEHNGRFYVLDYKTNALDNYQSLSLTQAMREHNYGLQYWLYSVVLDQYLKQRLPDYQFTQHFGGVFYLFVRGMNPLEAGSGVFFDCPEQAKIQRLAEVLLGA